jgi:hypothetical protein
MKLDKIAGIDFVADIKQIIDNARHKAYTSTSLAMVEAYWLVGKRIVEQEQQGEQRAAYGKEILKTLSNELGSGFSTRNLRDFRKFLSYLFRLAHLAHSVRQIELVTYSIDNESSR